MAGVQVRGGDLFFTAYHFLTLGFFYIHMLLTQKKKTWSHVKLGVM